MGLNNYLEKLSSNLVMSFEENEKIKASLKILKQMIDDHLSHVLEHFTFGSYTRGTKLTHLVDPKTDVDYLIVFNKTDLETPTMLVDRLIEFVESHFSTHNIIQTRPTCIVDINGTYLELIPAYKEGKYLINYKIPNSTSDAIEWIASVPNEHNSYLSKFDSEHDYYIIPLIRIFKYWNIINDSILSSFLLENELMFSHYPKMEQISEYFFFAVEHLTGGEELSENQKKVLFEFRDKIKILKNEPDQEKALHLISTIIPYI